MNKKKKSFWQWIGLNKRTNRLEEILVGFYGDKSMDDFVIKQQEELSHQQEMRHRQRVREKYNYLKHRLTMDDKLTYDEEKELKYITFLIEKQWSRS